MNLSHPAEQLEALRQFDACTLANATEAFRVRLRNEGFAGGGSHCLFPQLPPMVGYAATITIRSSSPPVAGASTYVEHTDWWDYVLSVPAPRILAVQDLSAGSGRGAFLGEVHINLLRALGCVGAVTNGTVRDQPALAELCFPVFAAGLSVSHSYVHLVATGEPVLVDGLAIRSGDLLHGDRHGFQTIPPGIVADLPAVAEKILTRERALLELARMPGVSLERLRAAVTGTQPA